jgi:hypothetical protein
MAKFKTQVTPEEARRVWESMESPSYQRVARALTKAGKPVSKSAIYWWAKRGWSKTPDPAKEALDELDSAVPVLTGDALRRLESLAAELDAVDDGVTDEERIARGLRELAACSLTVLRIARVVEPGLIVWHPDRIAVLMEKAGNALLVAIEGLRQLSNIRAADATDITPVHEAEAEPAPLLVGTLEAIRRAREKCK